MTTTPDRLAAAPSGRHRLERELGQPGALFHREVAKSRKNLLPAFASFAPSR